MRRNRRLAFCMALLLALLCGCGGEQAGGTRRRVALIVKSTDSEFFLSVFAGARAAAAEYNLDLSISGPKTEEDYETQNWMIGEAVEQGAEVLVFSAIDYERNAAAIDAAAGQGVKIVSIDSGVGSSFVSTYIGTDNYAAGQMAAQAALESAEGSLHVGIVNYNEGTANGQQRVQGAMDALDENNRVQSVTVATTLVDVPRAQTDTIRLMWDHPEINVLITFNELTSIGVAQAIRTLNREDKIFFVGFDSNVVTVDGLQSGSVDALIVQNPYAMGYLGVESAYKLLTGQGGLEAMVDTSTQIVNRENLFTIDAQKALFAFEAREN